MRITTQKMPAIACMFVMTMFVSIITTGVEQELKTLKLVNVYDTEEKLRSLGVKNLPESPKLHVNQEEISFIDADTGKISKQMKAFELTPLTKAEHQQLRESKGAKPVLKDAVIHRLSPDLTLLLETEATVKLLSPDYVSEDFIEVKKNTLYNAYGEVITQLPPEITTVVESPDSSHFVAYAWENVQGPTMLYFYTHQGILLQEREIIDSAQVTYSPNGEYVQVYSHMKREFAIFTKAGNIIYQGNRRELTKPILTPLWGVFASEEGEFMLLTTDQYINLYSTGGDFLWTYPSPGLGVKECRFFKQQEMLCIKIINQQLNTPKSVDKYDIHIHSLSTGEILDTISGIGEISVVNDHLIIKKGGRYYEYQVR